MPEKNSTETQLPHGYTAELWVYGIGVFLGTIAVFMTARRFYGQRRNNFVIAARLMSYKVSLTIADLIILFIYAPTQFIWINTYFWYGGDFLCRAYKFIMTFGFHLTANMQVLIALDRLYITARLNQLGNMRKNSGAGRFTRYGPNVYIMFAYLLAFTCALPQLFVFQLAVVDNEGNTQCTGIWTLARNVHHNNKSSILKNELKKTGQYDHLSANISRWDLNEAIGFYQKNNITIPKAAEAMDKDLFQILWIEQAYSLFHLASVCVIPYLIELLCYASILYLLKGAKKGRFLNVKDIAKMRLQWCALPPLFRRRPKYKEAPKRQISLDTERTDLPDDQSAKFRIKTEANDDEIKATKSALIGAEEHSARRSSLIISSDGRSTISSDCPTVPLVSSNANPNSERSTTTASPGLLLSVQNVLHKYGRANVTGQSAIRSGWMRNLNPTRRASCPEAVHKEVKPWMNTVAVARRNTKRKAFLMLTLNLIFWAPYCILALVNAIIVFHEYHYFQFVCALIVFNAVTNILL